MTQTRVLLVDDDEIIRMTLTGVLEQSGFAVTNAANVPEALKLISGGETYDVLLSDLHMPGAGDGLTVISAMRQVNPKAVTLLLSAYPEMTAAVTAILQQTDEILVKPIEIHSLVKAIHERMACGPRRQPETETVATILERTTAGTIRQWYERVEADPALASTPPTVTSNMPIPMSCEERCSPLPILFRDLILRLRSHQHAGVKSPTPSFAVEYGASRFHHGCTASMLAEEFRILQLTILHTLQCNLATIDHSALLLGVMTITDELASQLTRALKSFAEQTIYVDSVSRFRGAYGG
ncbi:MAG: response regulator [Acidobacteriaceae bacterium]